MKNKIIELNEEHINYLKEIKNLNTWKNAFWYEKLQNKFPELEAEILKNGSDFHNYGCYSTLDQAIQEKRIRLI